MFDVIRHAEGQLHVYLDANQRVRIRTPQRPELTGARTHAALVGKRARERGFPFDDKHKQYCAPTASANVELVRSIYAGWERGDFSSTSRADPEIEFARIDGPAPGSWRGAAQIASAVREMLTAWEDFRLVAAEYHELDGDRVLALATGAARGKRSGVELRASAANLFHIANGKMTRVVTYYDRERALADAGVATNSGG